MKTRLAIMLCAAFLLAPLAGFSQAPIPGNTAAVAAQAEGADILLAVSYLQRDSLTEKQDYMRASIFYALGDDRNTLGGGIELRNKDFQLRTYWFGDDISITDDILLALRLTHSEYPDWTTGINQASFRFAFVHSWFHAAIGFGYTALVFEPQNYRNPFIFNSEAPETRLIYELSARPSLENGRVVLGFGLRNFNDFEYQSFDDTGYFFEPSFQITDDTCLKLFYERRYGGLFISLPTLVRITYMATIEHRF